MQTKLSSLAETCISTAVGFGLSLLVWAYIIKPLYHIQTTGGQGMEITVIFTIASIIRGYVLRRVFSALHTPTKNKNKGITHVSTISDTR